MRGDERLCWCYGWFMIGIDFSLSYALFDSVPRWFMFQNKLYNCASYSCMLEIIFSLILSYWVMMGYSWDYWFTWFSLRHTYYHEHTSALLLILFMCVFLIVLRVYAFLEMDELFRTVMNMAHLDILNGLIWIWHDIFAMRWL